MQAAKIGYHQQIWNRTANISISPYIPTINCFYIPTIVKVAVSIQKKWQAA
jgi:hypothetical protein